MSLFSSHMYTYVHGVHLLMVHHQAGINQIIDADNFRGIDFTGQRLFLNLRTLISILQKLDESRIPTESLHIKYSDCTTSNQGCLQNVPFCGICSSSEITGTRDRWTLMRSYESPLKGPQEANYAPNLNNKCMENSKH